MRTRTYTRNLCSLLRLLWDLFWRSWRWMVRRGEQQTDCGTLPDGLWGDFVGRS